MKLATPREKRWARIRTLATDWEKGTEQPAVSAPDKYSSQEYNSKMEKAALNYFYCWEDC